MECLNCGLEITQAETICPYCGAQYIDLTEEKCKKSPTFITFNHKIDGEKRILTMRIDPEEISSDIEVYLNDDCVVEKLPDRKVPICLAYVGLHFNAIPATDRALFIENKKAH